MYISTEYILIPCCNKSYVYNFKNKLTINPPKYIGKILCLYFQNELFLESQSYNQV